MIELEGPLGKSDAVNHELVSLERELSTLRKNELQIKKKSLNYETNLKSFTNRNQTSICKLDVATWKNPIQKPQSQNFSKIEKAIQ